MIIKQHIQVIEERLSEITKEMEIIEVTLDEANTLCACHDIVSPSFNSVDKIATTINLIYDSLNQIRNIVNNA